MKDNQKLKKIPILVSRNGDCTIKGWRAEIADNYNDYKTTEFGKINFEDLNFHFNCWINGDVHDMDHFVFIRKRDAMECARHVNKLYLSGKAKIWSIK